MNTVSLMRVIDLGLFIGSIAAIWFVFAGRLVRSAVAPSTGRWMMLVALCILIAHQAAELAFKFMGPTGSFIHNPSFLPTNIPTPIHWLMTRASFALFVAGMTVELVTRKRAELVFASQQSKMIQAAQKSVMMLEARFRSLLDVTPNPSFCWAFDPPLKLPTTAEELRRASLEAFLVECNTPFVDLHTNRTTADIIGRRLAEERIGYDVNAHRRLAAAFIEGGFRLNDYEFVYRNEDGSESAHNVSLTGIVEDGHLLRIWGSETDMHDMRETQTALKRRQSFQDLVAGISSYMIMTPIERSEQIVEHCLKEIGEFIEVDRSSVVWFDWKESKGYVNFDWDRKARGVQEEISHAEFPVFGEQIREGRVIKVDNVDENTEEAPKDHRRLRTWGIKSFVALPLSVANEVVGAVSFATTEEARHWSDQDILDLRVIAELFANFVSRLKSHTRLNTALEELEKAKERLEEENVYLREEIKSSHGFDEIIGKSEPILRSLRMVEMVAETETPVLILGETGTGKELFARAIHQRSKRKQRPLVKVNCATLPANLIESELFGYERGAFTGASARKRGRFDLADGSTLFLDEFGELPLELQTKLLRVLQEGEFERLGGTETIKVDVRLIVATNRDLAAAVRNGSFRSDLFYRVNTFPIHIPPLRDREGDVELLAQHFAAMYAPRMNRDVEEISANMMRQLVDYHWPGNVRELEGVIQRAVIAGDGNILDLPGPIGMPEENESAPKHRIVSSTIADLNTVEREHILSVLEETGWKISGADGAASKLGLPPSTLRSKMKKLEISKSH